MLKPLVLNKIPALSLFTDEEMEAARVFLILGSLSVWGPKWFSLSLDEIPSVISVINGDNAFVEDTNNINNGYPILKWQAERENN